MCTGQFTLGVDLDGVLFDFDRAWVERYKRDFPDEARGLEPGMPQKWNDLCDRTRFGSLWHFWQWWDTTGGFSRVPVYPGAVPALWDLIEQGVRIVYITARPFMAEQHTRSTVKDLLRVGAPIQGLIYAEVKHLERFDLIVEDNPHTIEEIADTRGRKAVIRIDRPWNQPSDYPRLYGVDTFASLPQVKSYWGDIYEERS